MNPRLKKILSPILSVLFWVGVWELAAWRIGNKLLFPNLCIVLKTLWELLGTRDFYNATWHSLWNVLSGILIALAIGILLAVVTYKIPFMRELALPMITVIKATPVASFIVLLLIFIGAPKVPSIITFLIVLPVVWTNLDEGLRQQSKQLAEVARIYKIPFFKKLWIFTIPSVKPFFISACRTSLGLAWKAGIAAEIIAMPRGAIGTMIGEARLYLETEKMFAWTLTVILLSLLIEFGFVSLLNLWDKRTIKEVA